MTTPAQVLAALPAPQRAELTRRSDRAGGVHLLGHMGAIVAMMAYVGAGMPLWWAMMLPLGVAMAFLFTLQHECTHRTPFATPWVNDVVGHVCALILVQPFEWFRAFHMAHHKHTNDPAHDPELQGDAKPETWATLAWHLSTVGYWGGKCATLWANATAPSAPYISPRASPRIKRESRILIAAYALAALATVIFGPILIWVWLLPLILGFPVLRMYLLAEHGQCPQVANMFENSRTTHTTKLVHFIAWNMPYHAEHHAYPNVPFHKLPDAHEIAKSHLGTLTNGYVRFAKDYVKPL